MEKPIEVTLKSKYEQDSKRFHRLRIVDPEGNVSGSVYFSKELKVLPERVTPEREDNK
jgi:hypothetical protein